MSERITYWDNVGSNHLCKSVVMVGSIAYVSHDEKTVTVVDTYCDLGGEERETNRTYYRNLEDAKREMIISLREHVTNIEDSIKRIEDYQE